MVLMMKSFTLSLLVFVLLGSLSVNAVAQTSRLQYADRQFELANYRLAADEYAKAYPSAPTYELAVKTAMALDGMYAFGESYTWWKKAVAFSQVTKQDYAALLRAGYRSINRYSPASDLVGTAFQLTDFAEFAALSSTTQVAYRVTGLKSLEGLNSQASDYSLSGSAAGLQFFSSNRGEDVAFKKAGIRFDAKGNGLNKNYFKSDGKNYYSIYSSQSNQEVKRVQVSGFELYHLTDPQLTATGKLFFTGTPNKLKKKDQVIFPGIFYGNYDAASGIVSGVKAFPANQTNAYGVLSPWLDEEQKRLYFSSNRPGGQGGYDLYYVTWDEAMNFSEPISLGEAINSPSNERDGQRFGEEFYFSSDRTGGAGGLDVYMSTLKADQFTKGINLGLPVNSAADDFGFVKIANNEAYLSSDRAEGMGSDDLYALTWENRTLKIFIANEAGNQINSGTTLQLKGNGEAIDISGISEAALLSLLEKDNTYTLVANRPGYFPQELTFSYNEEVKELVVNMVPVPYALEVYKAIIYYDFDKDLLRDLSKEKLDELTALLAKHPELSLVIESHTDSRASDSYNEELSARRAKSVTDYLEAKGINSDRVSASWFSEEKLVNDCGDGVPCPASDHQLNRRTELKLIAYSDQNKAYGAPVGASPADFKSRESMVLWFLKK